MAIRSSPCKECKRNERNSRDCDSSASCTSASLFIRSVICTRCSKPILEGPHVGDGDGLGQRFAHLACYNNNVQPSASPTNHPDILRADIADLFGEEVAELVEGVTKLSRLEKLQVWRIPTEASQALAALAERSMQLQATVQENALTLSSNLGSVVVEPVRWK